MPPVSMHSTAPPEAVFAVLSDGWRYADWVVGAKTIRNVDADWPTPGAKFHHKVGFGPIEIKDSSTLEAIDPPRSMTLNVRARPAGVARVHITLEPDGEGGTNIELDEHPIAGIAKLTDNPIQRTLLRGRNLEALRRLKNLAEQDLENLDRSAEAEAD
ncbi:MAG TPA: SRPBCC family protein [Acidimicrobiales bacterium]|nr:SRPBCC family protein [Acidimicrobiales bacterium]